MSQELPTLSQEPCRISVSAHDVAAGGPVAQATFSFWRVGAKEPELVHMLSADKPDPTVSLPAGQWIVIAHADGYRAASGTQVSMPHKSPERASISMDSNHPECVGLTSRPGEACEVNFAMQRLGEGAVRFSVTAPREAVSPYIVLWKRGNRKPAAALLDISPGSLDTTLQEGQWYATAAAESRTPRLDAAVSTGETNPDGGPATFNVTDGGDEVINFSRTTSTNGRSGIADITIGCWKDESHQQVEEDAVVVVWQDFRPESLIAFSSNSAAEFRTSLSAGTWHIAATVPQRAGNVRSRLTSTHHDATRHGISDNTAGSNEITLTVASSETYRADFAFPEIGNDEAQPTTPQPTQPQSTTPQPTTPQPVPQPLIAGATIHGHVFSEKTDGTALGLVKDARIELTDSDGRVLGSVLTNAGGYYAFDGVSPGALKATISGTEITTSTRDVQLGEDIGTHVLDFIVIHGLPTQPSGTGTAEISVFEQAPEGKLRRTDASVILHQGSDRKIIEAASPLSGKYETELAPGTWKVMATAAGLADGPATEFTVEPGKTVPHEIVLEPGSSDDVGLTAIVSVKRQYPGQKTAAPSVTFGTQAAVTATPIDARELDATATDDLSSSYWDWFKAKPGAAVADGTFDVIATLEGYGDQTDSVTWSEGRSRTAFFSLLPTATENQPEVLLAGDIYLLTGNGPRELLPGTSVTLTPGSGGDPVRTNATGGHYQTSLTTGQWSAQVVDDQHRVIATAEIFLGATPTQTHDFVVHREDTRQPPGQATDVYVLVEVADSGNAAPPNVALWTQHAGPVKNPDGTFAATGTALYRDKVEVTVQKQPWRSFDGTSWYVARPRTPISAGRTVTAMAAIAPAIPGFGLPLTGDRTGAGSANDGWVQVPTRATGTVAADHPTELRLTLRRGHQAQVPGFLAGCITYADGQPAVNVSAPVYYSVPDEGPIATPFDSGQLQPIEELEQPPTRPVLNATLLVRSTETGQLFSAPAPDGCFELPLPAGTWKLSVSIPGRDVWPVPDEVVIREGDVTTRDIVMPAEDTPHDCGSQVTIYAAVRLRSGNRASSVPFLELRGQITEHVAQSYTVETSNGELQTRTRMVPTVKFARSVPCTVRALSPAEVRRLGFGQRPEGNWTWYVGQPSAPVSPGTYIATGQVDGCDLTFPVDAQAASRPVSPGISTVFDLLFDPFTPTVNVVVNGSDGRPVPDVEVRLINTDVGQSFLDVSPIRTDARGQASTALESGVGTYNVFLSGQGIAPQGRQEDIRDSVTELSYRIFAAGETKTFPLAAIVSGETTVYEQRTRTLPDGTEASYTVGVPLQIAVGEGTVQIRGLAEQTLPAQLQQPLAFGSEGRVKWDGVPQGRYELVANAPDFLESRQEVDVIGETEPVSIVLTRRNVEFEDAVRQLLTDCWGGSPDQRRMADEAWQRAKAVAPGNPAADFAMALVMYHRNDHRECLDLLQSLDLQPPQPTDPTMNQTTTHRCHELLIWVNLLLKNHSEVTGELPVLARTVYAAGPENSAGIDTVYTMGIASGYIQGPGAGRGRRWEANFDDDMTRLLFAAYQPEYIRGRDFVLNRYGQSRDDRDAEAQRGEEQLAEDRERAKQEIDSQLEIVKGKMAEFTKQHDDLKKKAEDRLAEIQAELRQRIPTRDQLLADAQRIDGNLQRWRAELAQLLQMQERSPAELVPRGGAGDFRGGGGGGFRGGGGGFLFEGARLTPDARPADGRRDDVGLRSYILTAAQQETSPARREQQLRRLIFQAETNYQQVAADYNRENNRILSLQADEQAVRNAWNNTFQQLDGPFRELEARQNQLLARRNGLQNARPGNTDNIRRIDRDLRSLQTYMDYLTEERRRQVLDSL